MNRKLTIKRKVNKYGLGDWLNKNSEGIGEEAFGKENLGGTLGELTGGITQVVEAGVANAQIKDTSAEHASIENTANTTFDASDTDSLAAMWDNSLLQNSDYTQKAVRGVTPGQMVGNTLKGAASGAMTGAKIGGLWGGIGGFVAGAGAGVAGILTGNAKARREAANLNAEAKSANRELLANYSLAADNIADANFNTSLLNFAAYGGELNNLDMNKKSYGGPIYNHTGDWTNGITFIDEGGLHSENPFEGVMVGVDNEGTPNLVEEGEIIFNDYVFSNRLKPTKKILADGGFPDKYNDWTFAKIAEDLQKESAERPTDFISNNTLNDMMNRLITFQEMVREKKKSNQYKQGGLVNKFDGGTPNKKKPSLNLSTIGRYAPVVTNAASLINNLFDKQDTYNIDRLERVAQNLPKGTYTPLGDYINIEPVDKNYLLNPIINTGRATARDLQNQGVDPRGSLLVNAYNTQRAIGSALLQADQENIARAVQEAEFNRGTNQANSSMGLQALAMNQDNAKTFLNTLGMTTQLREAYKAQKAAGISSSASALPEDIAGIATENYWKDQIENNPAFMEYIALMNKAKNSGKCGGMLTRKKRR